MLRLRGVEVVEELPGFRCIVTMSSQVRNALLLLCNVALALGNMPLGLF